MFEYFYNEIFRKTVVGFGTLFNNIHIVTKDDSGGTASKIKVPLAYGPTQKFLARLRESSSDLNNPVQITLPRLSFEMTGITYDSSRKSTTTQTFLSKSSSDSKEVKKTYLPVPYNVNFDLGIISKTNDDALQIVEQILPYFQPSYSISINLVNDIQEKRDIPIILNDVIMQNDYEGNFSSRTAITYTLKFTAKTYIFGPTASASSELIKKSTIGLGIRDTGYNRRELSYSVEPRAIKSYTDNVATVLVEDIEENIVQIKVDNPINLSKNSYVEIDGEEMYIKDIQGNVIIVERGKDGTLPSIHLAGTEIKLLTKEDNSLIEFGDDFGFSEF